jgi:hypothetical protein
MDQTIELQPILDRLEKRPPLGLVYSDETEGMLPGIGGGLTVALAHAFKILDPGLKHPHSERWDRANQIFGTDVIIDGEERLIVKESEILGVIKTKTRGAGKAA